MIRKYLLSVPFGALVKVASYNRVISVDVVNSAVLSAVIQVSGWYNIYFILWFWSLWIFFDVTGRPRWDAIKVLRFIGKIICDYLHKFFSLGFKNPAIIFLWAIIEICYQHSGLMCAKQMLTEFARLEFCPYYFGQ